MAPYHIFVLSSEIKKCDFFESKQLKLEDCKQLSVVLSSNFSFDTFDGESIYQEDDDPAVDVLSIKYPVHWTAKQAAIFGDKFLTPRPWWMVITERYDWDSRPGSIDKLRLIRMPVVGKLLKQLAKTQYTSNCETSKYSVRCTGDFNEYGAEYSNIMFLYLRFGGDIVDIWVVSNAHWVHDTYCPDTPNKFRCAFLPTHNCTVPALPETECKSLVQYDKATLDGKAGYEYVSEAAVSDEMTKSSITYKLKDNIHDFSNYVTTNYRTNIKNDIFYIGLLFRQNYDYRSRVSQLVEEYRKMNHFKSTEKCISFHIRRGDRVIDGKNMLQHCKYIKDLCYNESNVTHLNLVDDHNNDNLRSESEELRGAVFSCLQYRYDYFGLGCQTAIPYGGLSFDMYMSAANIIRDNMLKADGVSVSTIVVMTNDHGWSVNQSKAYLTDWKVHVMPQPPHFRGSSVEHGVINQASIELTQQCSALVGHFNSAFTRLLFFYMCYRHGPLDDLTFSQCPIRFDFGGLAKNS